MDEKEKAVILSSECVYLHFGDEYIKINEITRDVKYVGSDPTHVEIVGWIDPPVDLNPLYEDISLEFSGPDDKDSILTHCDMSCVSNTEGCFPGLPENVRIITVWSTKETTLLYMMKGVTLYKIAFND